MLYFQRFWEFLSNSLFLQPNLIDVWSIVRWIFIGTSLYFFLRIIVFKSKHSVLFHYIETNVLQIGNRLVIVFSKLIRNDMLLRLRLDSFFTAQSLQNRGVHSDCPDGVHPRSRGPVWTARAAGRVLEIWELDWANSSPDGAPDDGTVDGIGPPLPDNETWPEVVHVQRHPTQASITGLLIYVRSVSVQLSMYS